MGRTGVQKQRSRGWWAVLLSACLAMGVYIAFDVLDLDGSDLRDLGPGTAIAAESPSAETDRLLPQILTRLEGQRLVSLRVDSQLTAEASRLFPRGSLNAVATRLDALRPRAHLSRDTSSADSLMGILPSPHPSSTGRPYSLPPLGSA